MVEIDAYYSHGLRQEFEDDRRRDITLRLAGWEVFRITETQRREQPREVIALLQRILGRSESESLR